MKILTRDMERSVEMERDVIEPFLTQHSPSTNNADRSTLNSEYPAPQTSHSEADLQSHTQRISHLIEIKDTKAIYSALVDLFLVLGNKGLALRKRILISACSLLTDQQFDSLKNSLLLGLKSKSELPLAQQSLLARGHSMPFFETVELKKTSLINVSDEVQSYLATGQIDQAISVLKDAILKNPRQLSLQNDLLEIFQQAAKKESFISFYQQLLSRKVVLPPLWKKIALQFDYDYR